MVFILELVLGRLLAAAAIACCCLFRRAGLMPDFAIPLGIMPAGIIPPGLPDIIIPPPPPAIIFPDIIPGCPIFGLPGPMLWDPGMEPIPAGILGFTCPIPIIAGLQPPIPPIPGPMLCPIAPIPGLLRGRFGCIFAGDLGLCPPIIFAGDREPIFPPDEPIMPEPIILAGLGA